MRVLPVLTLFTVASSALVAAETDRGGVATVKTDVQLLPHMLQGDHKQVTRFLRQYISEGFDSDGEERNPLDKVDDVVTKLDDMVGTPKKLTPKLDDMVGKPKKPTPKLDALRLKNLDEFHKTALAVKLNDKYDDAIKLSLSTLKQLDDVETRRVKDIATYSKNTGKSMRREIEPFDGIKIAPAKFLESHVGRENQLFGKDGSRLLSAAVVSRPKNQGDDDVLLISSSNPNKGDWLLPKGGWDKGEDVKRAALREVIEEGGVNAKLAHSLGRVKFSEGKNKYTYYAYMVKATTVYDDWAESSRYRIWVSFDDAIKLLAKRPQMVKVVEQAKKVDAKVKSGKLPETNPKMRKFTLDLE